MEHPAQFLEGNKARLTYTNEPFFFTLHADTRSWKGMARDHAHGFLERLLHLPHPTS